MGITELERHEMSLTTDRTHEGLYRLQDNGQQEAYLILSDEERAKGFVRPVRLSYRHVLCGHVTTMAQAIAETYARDPKFYTGTFCGHCMKHFPLIHGESTAFTWEPDGSPVGA